MELPPRKPLSLFELTRRSEPLVGSFRGVWRSSGLWKCLAAVLILFALFQKPTAAVYAKWFSPYPSGWTAIRPGMTVEEIYRVIGKPEQSTLETKGMERWEVSNLGVEMHLDVSFNYHGVAGVESWAVSVSRWKRVLWSGQTVEDTVEP